MADEIKLSITLDDGSVKEGFFSIEKNAKKTANNLEGTFSGAVGALNKQFVALGATLAAAFTVGKFIDFMKDSAKAAGEAEKATSMLANSLALIGQYSKAAVDDFSAYASMLQRTTGIEDDFIKQNAALLVSIGGLSGQVLKDATKAALDLAKAFQIDAGTAFDVIAKASVGNTMLLNKYRIKVSEAIPESERFAEILKLIQQRFGGLAETNLGTFEGAMTNLSNAFGEVKESIGGLITSSPALRDAINTISKYLFTFADDLAKKFSGKDFFKDFLIGMIDFASALNTFVLLPVKFVFDALILGFKGVLTVLAGVVAYMTKIPALVIEYVISPLIKAFGWVSEVVLELFNEDFAASFRKGADNVANFVTAIATGVNEGAVDVFKESLDGLFKTADNSFSTKATDGIDAFLAKLKNAVLEAKTSQDDLKNNTVTNTKAMSEAWQAAEKSINQALQQGIMKTVTTSLATIGASLVNGGEAFKDFTKVVLGILGDLAIQVGGILIAMGIGIENLKIALTSWNAASLIIAGAALVVLGGALKALAGGSGAAVPASGGGTATSPSPSTELTPDQGLTRAEQATQVSIVIQGDVLDSDSSGSRIVSLINEAFNKKGVVIQQGVIA